MTDTILPSDVALLSEEAGRALTHELRSLGRPRAPRSPGFVRLRDDVPANGRLYISSHGNGYALAFKGGRDFIDRWHNWAINSGVVASTRLYWYLGDCNTGRLAHICVKSKDVIVNALAAQFRWELIRDREVPPLVDTVDPDTEERTLEYDEEKLDAIARQRAVQFMAERITVDATILVEPKDVAQVYSRSDETRRTGTDD